MDVWECSWKVYPLFEYTRIASVRVYASFDWRRAPMKTVFAPNRLYETCLTYVVYPQHVPVIQWGCSLWLPLSDDGPGMIMFFYTSWRYMEYVGIISIFYSNEVAKVLANPGWDEMGFNIDQRLSHIWTSKVNRLLDRGMRVVREVSVCTEGSIALRWSRWAVS